MKKNDQYLFDGLNRLNKLLDEKRILKSKMLLSYIERKMITALIVAKKDPTKENLDRAYAMHVKKFGGELLMYRHFANQQMEVIVNKTINHLKFNEHAIHKIQEIELEPNLSKLRGRDPAVSERMIEAGRAIKEARALIEQANKDQISKSNEKKLSDFIVKSVVSEASESLFETVVKAAKDAAIDTIKDNAKSFGMSFKPSSMEAGGL